MSAHARLGPSSAHRWMRCPGSSAAELQYQDRRTTSADEGSAAHALAEMLLENGGDPFARIGQHVSAEHPIEITAEMASAVGDYVDYVIGLGGVQLYEARLDLSHLVPNCFGTSDAICVVGSTLYVVDLKYGKGVKVYAEENEQAQMYALGALELFSHQSFERVVCVIVQPRLDHIDEWETTPEALLAFGERLKQAAAETAKADAPRNPGAKQCQFCRAKADCPALARFTESVIGASFDNLDAIEPPERLSAEQLRRALDAKSLIASWLSAVEDLVIGRLNAGEPFPGYKLVAGRSLRKWADEQKAAAVLEEKLGASAWSRDLISVSQAEKLIGKKAAAPLLVDLVTKPEGKPTLVPESDPREPLTVTTANCFDSFTSGDD